MSENYRCRKCAVDMDLQPYKRPYITSSGIVVTNVYQDVYICPCCGKEEEILPNEEDGYSCGAGLFSED